MKIEEIHRQIGEQVVDVMTNISEWDNTNFSVEEGSVEFTLGQWAPEDGLPDLEGKWSITVKREIF